MVNIDISPHKLLPVDSVEEVFRLLDLNTEEGKELVKGIVDGKDIYAVGYEEMDNTIELNIPARVCVDGYIISNESQGVTDNVRVVEPKRELANEIKRELKRELEEYNI